MPLRAYHLDPDRIRQAREAVGMSREALGVAVGRSASSIALYECGRGSPTVAVLEALVDALGVSPGDLFTEANTDAVAVGETGPAGDAAFRGELMRVLASAETAQRGERIKAGLRRSAARSSRG